MFYPFTLFDVYLMFTSAVASVDRVKTRTVPVIRVGKLNYWAGKAKLCFLYIIIVTPRSFAPCTVAQNTRPAIASALEWRKRTRLDSTDEKWQEDVPLPRIYNVCYLQTSLTGYTRTVRLKAPLSMNKSSSMWHALPFSVVGSWALWLGGKLAI
jgi:hypothetical protein